MQETLAACSLWSDDRAARMDHLATVDLQLLSVADVRTQASMIMEKYETLNGMEVFVLFQILHQGSKKETHPAKKGSKRLTKFALSSAG